MNKASEMEIEVHVSFKKIRNLTGKSVEEVEAAEMAVDLIVYNAICAAFPDAITNGYLSTIDYIEAWSADGDPLDTSEIALQVDEALEAVKGEILEQIETA